MTKNRLHGALVCYAVLALIAIAALKGRLLLIILILMGALAIKSWIAYAKERHE